MVYNSLLFSLLLQRRSGNHWDHSRPRAVWQQTLTSCFIYWKNTKLQTCKLRTTEGMDAAVSRFPDEIKTTIRRASQFRFRTASFTKLERRTQLETADFASGIQRLKPSQSHPILDQVRTFGYSDFQLQRLHRRSWGPPQRSMEGHQIFAQIEVANHSPHGQCQTSNHWPRSGNPCWLFKLLSSRAQATTLSHSCPSFCIQCCQIQISGHAPRSRFCRQFLEKQI